MRNSGQVFTSPKRFFVHEKTFDRFADAFAMQAAATVVANCMEEKIEMGPLAHVRRVEALTAFAEDTKAKGARVLTGGPPIGNKGYFFAPTVLSVVPDNARVMQKKPFGPMA